MGRIVGRTKKVELEISNSTFCFNPKGDTIYGYKKIRGGDK